MPVENSQSEHTAKIPRKPRRDVKAVGRELRKSGNLTQALLAGGYSLNTARQGMATVNKSESLKREVAGAYADLVSRPVLKAELRAALVRNRLVENAVNGEDKAVNSCKLLMQDKEVDILRPDSMSGVIQIGVVNLPNLDTPDSNQ